MKIPVRGTEHNNELKMSINKYLILAVFALGVPVFVHSRNVPVAGAENVRLERTADGRMAVSMELLLGELELGRNRAAVFVPVLVNGSEIRVLKPVSIYGRNRWYSAQRSGADLTKVIRHSARPSVLTYSDSIPYEPWMDGARLELRRQDYGCCDKLSSESNVVLGNYAEPVTPAPYVPEFRYVRPASETAKVRALSGRAYVDFATNSTELRIGYRNNAAELSKITATIDSVRNDADITVTSITIKGSASPEGKYEINDRLAKGRTESLKDYVQKQSAFANGLLRTEYVAEDWEGLREYVAESSLPHKTELLEIIDDPALEPDTKDWRMKIRYAEDYKYLLENVFPSLRRSDYQIEYTVRSYEDVETIRRIYSESPEKLSVSELYRLSEMAARGSAEQAEILETAARLYPEDEIANLNAANVAMQLGDLAKAARYLEKAGETAEAAHAREVLRRLREQEER